jgi:hypothetical protein
MIFRGPQDKNDLRGVEDFLGRNEVAIFNSYVLVQKVEAKE